MTTSPDLRVSLRSLPVYCSAIIGDTLALIAPAPRPMITMERMSRPSDRSVFWRAEGVEEPTRMM